MQDITIVQPVPDDALPLIDYMRKVTAETPYLRMNPEDFRLTRVEEEAFIGRMRSEDNCHMLLARDGESIAGVATVHGVPYSKFRHRGELGITVLREQWGRGIGTRLMEEMLGWARANEKMTTLDLYVNSENAPATALFKRFGFTERGRKTRDFFYEGRYVDTIFMELDVDM
jgi:RimJ/RimL family protein N-acetyltransferase